MKMRRTKNLSVRGFSLVEILVALAAFGLLAIAGGSIASSAIATQDQLQAADSRLRALQTTRALLKADLAQVVIRGTRSSYGGRRPSIFDGRTPQPEVPFLSFVRGGWINPAARENRASLQYVEYRWDGSTLSRKASVRLDSTPDTPEFDSVVLTGVENLSVSFLLQGVWRPEWRSGPELSATAPDAVALEFDLDGFGRIRQVFRTAAS